MLYDNDLVSNKLRYWEGYIKEYKLPTWDEIPNFGLYMEQIISLLQKYLDYMPPELKEEQLITASTINNYVRTKTMPKPKKKKYYREHLAYLIMILTLKQSLSLALIQKLIPLELSTDELKSFYTSYVKYHSVCANYFTKQVTLAASPILNNKPQSEISINKPEDLIIVSAIIGGFTCLLAEKLISLKNQNLEERNKN